MAKKLQFPKRRTSRFSLDTDGKLVERAKRLNVPTGVAIRLSVEQSLELPDPEPKQIKQENV